MAEWGRALISQQSLVPRGLSFSNIPDEHENKGIGVDLVVQVIRTMEGGFNATDCYQQNLIFMATDTDYSRWVHSQIKHGDWLLLKKLKSYNGTLRVKAFDISKLPLWSFDVQEGLRKMSLTQ